MDRVKGITKNGYHPTGKDGGKESWRGDYKGINQVASWVGKGKNPNDSRSAKEHHSQPLTSLRDPDSFGPPPKNLNYHGTTASSPTSSVAGPPHRAIGTQLSSDGTSALKEEQIEQGQAIHRPAPPPLPYRADRTGINSSSLPTPPVRRLGDATGGSRSSTSPSPEKRPPKPNLPPRLPPRQNSNPLQTAPMEPPPTYAAATEEQREWAQQNQPPPPPARHNVFANQEGALSRLGSAGVKVPGLGIGGSSSSTQAATNPWANESSTATGTNDTTHTSSLSGLSSRFSSLSTTAPPPPASSPPPSTGTTWAEKQAAFKTASSFRNDPSSISLADAKATASTANNFRERHGEQVAQGWKVGNGLNKKYGIADRVGAAAGSPAAEQNPIPPSSSGQANPWAGAIGAASGINRKPPPPPVPLESKPR